MFNFAGTITAFLAFLPTYAETIIVDKVNTNNKTNLFIFFVLINFGAKVECLLCKCNILPETKVIPFW
jgi:hypothetical protein